MKSAVYSVQVTGNKVVEKKAEQENQEAVKIMIGSGSNSKSQEAWIWWKKPGVALKGAFEIGNDVKEDNFSIVQGGSNYGCEEKGLILNVS